MRCGERAVLRASQPHLTIATTQPPRPLADWRLRCWLNNTAAQGPFGPRYSPYRVALSAEPLLGWWIPVWVHMRGPGDGMRCMCTAGSVIRASKDQGSTLVRRRSAAVTSDPSQGHHRPDDVTFAKQEVNSLLSEALNVFVPRTMAVPCSICSPERVPHPGVVRICCAGLLRKRRRSWMMGDGHDALQDVVWSSDVPRPGTQLTPPDHVFSLPARRVANPLAACRPQIACAGFTLPAGPQPNSSRQGVVQTANPSPLLLPPTTTSAGKRDTAQPRTTASARHHNEMSPARPSAKRPASATDRAISPPPMKRKAQTAISSRKKHPPQFLFASWLRCIVSDSSP